MAKYNSLKIASQALFMQAMGNCTIYRDTCTVATALVLNDTMDLIKVPSGNWIDELRLKNDDFDTGTTLQVSLGYRAADANSATVAAPTFFGSALTILQAASSATVPYSPQFNPFLTNEDIIIYATVTAAPTGGGVGSIRTWVQGEAVGTK